MLKIPPPTELDRKQMDCFCSNIAGQIEKEFLLLMQRGINRDSAIAIATTQVMVTAYGTLLAIIQTEARGSEESFNKMCTDIERSIREEAKKLAAKIVMANRAGGMA